MSDIIQLLPDAVANQIAAGEVIQRPASVVKELVENAIDAGAKTIHVLVVDAGRTSLQVIDDGRGMSVTDARLAFERHATSKIRTASDLFALTTMGFRGEALASIAAVAQVALKTRQPHDDVGTHLSIAGSKFSGQEPCSCPVGSNFLIENLFYNVPARRKFLKSNATELNHILESLERIVLVNPQVAFTLHSNGAELLNLKVANLRQRIVDVFGKRINHDLLPLQADTSICRISGFVGKPEAARKKGAHQYFFVNGRYMRHPYFAKAVQKAFERLVPAGEQVPFFIYFEVPPEDIDVNIHPVKTEIKFENEQSIWQILSAAVREAVGLFNDVPTIDFDTQGRPDIPVFDPHASHGAPTVQYNPQYNPFKQTPASGGKPSANGWETLYEGLRPQSGEGDVFGGDAVPMGDAGATLPAASNSPEGLFAEKSPAHYQYKGMYVMTAVKSGLMIIDQHRAHVRILYEQYMEQVRSRQASPQRVLFPEVVHFPASQGDALQHVLDEMAAMGFELTSLGGQSYAVNAVPAGLDGLQPMRLVEDMVQAALSDGGSPTDDVYHSLALNMAHHAAVPYGQVMNNEEMENLVNRLFACSNVNYTPDGKAILGILQQGEIERLLG